MICGRNLTGKEVESMQRVKTRGQGTFGIPSCRVVVHEGICLREGSFVNGLGRALQLDTDGVSSPALKIPSRELCNT
jgi:hypothetical protein